MSHAEYLNDYEAKHQILEVGRRMYEKGFVASNDGNISCRVSETELWTTPTGVSKGFMTEEMLVKVDLNGNLLSGERKPSSEIRMHRCVYGKTAGEERCPCCIRLLRPPSPLPASHFPPPFLPEAVVQLGVVPVANYATPGTQEVPDSIAPYCRSHNGVLLANHGALTWGKDPEQAYMRMESLEYYATVSMYTGHIIGQANELTCEQVDRLVDTRTRLGIQSGGRPVCRHAEAGEPRPCECGLCNLTPAALSELICHLIATLPEDVIRLLRHSS